MSHTANISNWRTIPDDVDTARHETGGFYAFGVDGMFRGTAIILFAFIAFDAMVMSRTKQYYYQKGVPNKHQGADKTREKIENFIRTITNAILSINAGLFLCLLGMALALTTIQPYYRLVSIGKYFVFFFLFIFTLSLQTCLREV